MKYPLSDHYDGKVFHNPTRNPHGLLGVLKWVATGQSKAWPKNLNENATPAKIVSSVTEGIRTTFINHATVLIQVDGVNFLTDPIWSERCSPFSFAGPKRYRRPGIAYADLPPIHCVLVSHNHYDHFDWQTLKNLIRDHDPYFVFGLGLESLAKKLAIRKAVFLDWWEKTEEMKFPITFVPAQHFSGRGLFDRERSLWGGFVLSTSQGPIFFAGDTGYGPHFKEIAKRLGAPVLSLIPIGAYEPRWFMEPVHLNPSDAVQAHLDLQSKQSMAIHFGTFKLSDEGIDDPSNDLWEALKKSGVNSKDFWVPSFGEARQI